MLRLDHVLEAKSPCGGPKSLTAKKTPLWKSESLSKMLGCELYLKYEHLQYAGSFKVRGVLNWMRLNPENHQEVATYSSGNHGLALAWACDKLDIPARIFVPEDLSERKRFGIKRLHAKLVKAGTSINDRRSACEAYVKKTGASLVPPFEAPEIIAGQGTIALEILEDLPMFDALLAPVGGGGLLAGIGIAMKSLRPRIQIVGCEPELANDFQHSLKEGSLVTLKPSKTIAEELRHEGVGSLNWNYLRETVGRAITCTEQSICRAFHLLAEEHNQIVEPSGAVSLACLLDHKADFKGKKVVVVLSGGNTTIKELTAWSESTDQES